jgi:hypothetical protein
LELSRVEVLGLGF